MSTAIPRNKTNFLLSIVLLFAAPVFGATVFDSPCGASVEISSGNYVSADNSDGSCGVSGANANSSMTAEIGGFPFLPPFPNGTVVPADSTVYGSVVANVHSYSGSIACETANHPFPCSAGASVYASETITFQTLGSPRPGIADLYTYGQAVDAGDGARASDGAGALESSSQVELGTTLSISGSASASTDGTDGENAQGYEDFWLVIYEADGVTPVTVMDVAATPEPSTWALALLCLSFTQCVRRSWQAHSKTAQ